jgi:signal peptidase
VRSWIAAVVSWGVILSATVVLTVAVLVPRLAGATPYTVLTGSMSPAMPPGTLVVVRPVPVEQIVDGSVITYQLESGRPTVVTHRVVATGITLGGERRFTTRGDANTAVDALPVRPVQVRGAVWYSVPYLGHLNHMLTGKERQMAVYIVAAGLLGYAAFMFTGAVRGRLRRRGVSP